MSDEPAVGGDIFIVPAEGGEARILLPHEGVSQLAYLACRRQNPFLVKT